MRWCTKIDKYQVGIKLHIPHQKSTRQMRKEYGRMNWWLVYVPDVLDWKLDKALMDSKLLFWDISIRSMSKTNYQFGTRLYLRKQKKCIFRLFDQNNKHEHQRKLCSWYKKMLQKVQWISIVFSIKNSKLWRSFLIELL